MTTTLPMLPTSYDDNASVRISLSLRPMVLPVPRPFGTSGMRKGQVTPTKGIWPCPHH
ncbi:hypothetical protein L873DRAFT_1824402, partial [Choiromyces venosus 120613-1]